MSEFSRKPNRLPAPAYLGPRSFLVTLCAFERKTIFTTNDVVIPLLELLHKQAGLHFFDIYAYCFMPDHCHLLLIGLNHSANLSELIRSFKGNSTVLLRRAGLHSVWQKGFHDHVIRDDHNLGSAAAYVLENPVRAGLAKRVHDWPFSGSRVFPLRDFQSPSTPFTPTWKPNPH